MRDEYGDEEYNGAMRVDLESLSDRLGELRRAVEWAALVERYGAEAVRQAEKVKASKLIAALDDAVVNVPTVEDLLREAGMPDVDSALTAELSTEWQRFSAEEGGES
jgi:hypothetical protein